MGARLAEEDSLAMRSCCGEAQRAMQPRERRHRGDYTRVVFGSRGDGRIRGTRFSLPSASRHRVHRALVKFIRQPNILGCGLEMSKEVRQYVGPSGGKRRSQSEVPARM